MPDRPPVSTEDVPQCVVEAVRAWELSRVNARQATHLPEWWRDALAAALSGYRLVRDDEATVERT